MANPEHLNILKQGIGFWNQWRTASTDVRPDLSGIDRTEANISGVSLKDADLRWAILFRADLTSADLSGADLNGADLRAAHLVETDLRGAKLVQANLSRAHLIGVNLIKADLRRADLRGANLRRAFLDGADFSGALVEHTGFADLDLRNVQGIDKIEHTGPSSIGMDTVYKSKGRIPEVFLRGIGVPDNFMAYMHSLVGTAFEYYSCFISYSSKDQEFADRLYADLQAKGVRCWFAPEDLKIGDRFRQRIDEAIRFHDKLLVVLSESSVNSNWVGSEVEAAFEKEAVPGLEPMLFPIRLDNAVMETHQSWAAEIRRRRHIGDFTDWKDHNSYQKAFHRLLRDLQGEKGKKAMAKFHKP